MTLTGATSVGKSYLAMAIVNAKVADERQALFCMIPQALFDTARVTRDREDACKLMSLAESTEPLALVDAGKERVTEWTREVRP